MPGRVSDAAGEVRRGLPDFRRRRCGRRSARSGACAFAECCGEQLAATRPPTRRRETKLDIETLRRWVVRDRRPWQAPTSPCNICTRVSGHGLGRCARTRPMVESRARRPYRPRSRRSSSRHPISLMLLSRHAAVRFAVSSRRARRRPAAFKQPLKLTTDDSPVVLSHQSISAPNPGLARDVSRFARSSTAAAPTSTAPRFATPSR